MLRPIVAGVALALLASPPASAGMDDLDRAWLDCVVVPHHEGWPPGYEKCPVIVDAHEKRDERDAAVIERARRRFIADMAAKIEGRK